LKTFDKRRKRVEIIKFMNYPEILKIKIKKLEGKD